jgi:hypothetical protein
MKDTTEAPTRTPRLRTLLLCAFIASVTPSIVLAEIDELTERERLKLTRQTIDAAKKIVIKHAGSRNISFFIDNSEEPETTTGNLREALGDYLAFAKGPHKQTIESIYRAHHVRDGWPGALVIQLEKNTSHSDVSQLCVVSTLSHKRSAKEFINHLYGTSKIPIISNLDEADFRLFSLFHEAYHCISGVRSSLSWRDINSSEVLSDVGAAYELLLAGHPKSSVIQFADSRAIRLATGIVEVVNGRVPVGKIIARTDIGHFSSGGLEEILALTHDQLQALKYEDIEQIVSNHSLKEMLGGDIAKVEKFYRNVFLIRKNTELISQFFPATIHDVPDILTQLGAPNMMIELVANVVHRYPAILYE